MLQGRSNRNRNYSATSGGLLHAALRVFLSVVLVVSLMPLPASAAQGSEDNSSANDKQQPTVLTLESGSTSDVSDSASGDIKETDSESSTTSNSRRVPAKAGATASNSSFNVDVPSSYQADGSQVETFKLSWITQDSQPAPAGNTATDDKLYVNPANNSDADLYLTAQIDYALSGEHDYAPGDVRITIPATIITNRDGTQGEVMVLPYPQAPSTSKDFNYTLSTDKNGNPVYVLTNTRTISAATKGVIQIGFSKITPHKVVDMATSKPFQAVIEVTTHAGNIIGRATNALTAQIDTDQKLTEVTKLADSMPQTTVLDVSATTIKPATHVISKDEFIKEYGQPSTFGLDPADEYLVVSWDVRLRHEGNQEFSVTVSDTIPSNANLHKGRIVRLDAYGGQSVSGTGSLTLTSDAFPKGWQKNGELKCYVYTAYPFTVSNFPYNETRENWYHYLDNNVRVTLKPADSNAVQYKDASAKVRFHYTRPTTKEPAGHFNLFKWGNDGADEEHMSSDVAKYGYYSMHYLWAKGTETTEPFSATSVHNGYYDKRYGIYFDALNRLSGVNEGTNPENVDITYTIEQNAFLLPWTYKSGYNPYKTSEGNTSAAYAMSNYGLSPVTTVLADTGLTMDGKKLTALDDYVFKSLYIPRPLVGYAQASNLSPEGTLISKVEDGTFNYKDATKYSSISNLEADGTEVGDLGPVEPIYVDIEVRNEDGTTTWINNYASLDYSAYEKMNKNKVDTETYENNSKAYIIYYYGPDGKPLYDVMPWSTDEESTEGEDGGEGEGDGGEGESSGEGTGGSSGTSTPVELPDYKSERGTVIDRLPANTVNFRTHVTSNKAFYHYYVLPTVTLKASADGAETVPTTIATAAFGTGETKEKQPSIDVVNKAQLQAYAGKNYPGDGTAKGDSLTSKKAVFEKEDDGIDDLRGYVTDTRAVPSKDGTFLRQDDLNAYLHYSAKMEFQSFIQDRSTYDQEVSKNHIPQVNEGIWYDLLPAGVTPNLSSVKLREGDAITSIYTIPNYRNSGRTMLVVKATLAPSPQKYRLSGDTTDYYEDALTIEFDAAYDIAAFKDHGDEPHNVVAFQATKTNQSENSTEDLVVKYLGSVDGYKGEYDTPATEGAQNNVTASTTGSNPTTVSDLERTWLTDLDNDKLFGAESGEDPMFLYAGTVTKVNAVYAAQTALSKSVSTNGDGIWTTGKDKGDVRMVYEDGYYSYRLRVASSADTSTSNIIIYDTLESFIPGQFGTDVNNPDENIHTPQWHGTLEGVNVEQIREAGDPDEVDAKVYYSVLKASQSSDALMVPANAVADDVYKQETISASDVAKGYTIASGEHAGVHSDPGPAPTLGKYTSNDTMAIQSQYALLDNSGKVNSAIWMTEDELKAKGYTLADATMIAIDARYTVGKNEDGTPKEFVLEPSKSLVAYVYMHAPAETDPSSEVFDKFNSRYYIAHNAHAFNNVYLFSTTTNASDGTANSNTSVRFDYTKVGLKEMKVPVQKVWDDENDHDGFRPTGGVRMYLSQTDVETGETKEKIRAIDVVKDGYYVVDLNTKERTGNLVTQYRDDETGVLHNLTDRWKDGWVGIFTGIPATNANGVPYAYSVTEEPVTFDNTSTYGEDGDKGQYTLSMGSDGDGGYVANNVHVPIRTSVEGEKTWLGDTDEELAAIYGSNDTHSQATVRPNYVDIDLYKTVNGTTAKETISKRVRPSADGTWSYAFDNLYKYENGKLITWTVKENASFDTYIPFQYNTADEIAWMDELEDAQAIARAIYRGYYIDSEGTRHEVASNPNGRYFINVYHPFGDIVLSKTVQNATKAAEDKNFTFEVDLQQEVQEPVFDEDGNATGATTTVLQSLSGAYEYGVFTLDGQGDPQPVMDPANPAKQLGGTVSSGEHITLKDGQFARIYDLPAGTRYSFTELETPGYTATGGTTQEGVLAPNESVHPFETTTNSVAYTNTYRSEGSTSLGVNKSLVGRPQQNHYQFGFDLTQLHVDSDGTPNSAETRLVRSAKTITLPGKNQADTNNATYASATFSGLAYSSETAPADVDEGWATHKVVNGKDTWTYVYEITESIPATATATFTIEEDGEEKEVELTYEDAQQSEHITAVQLASASWKLNGYTYDASRIRVTVAVTDEGDGTMSTIETYERLNAEGQWEEVAAPGPAPEREDYTTDEDFDDAVEQYYSGGRTFANEYAAEGQWQPQAWKRLPGRTLEKDQFSFVLQPLDPSREPLADATVLTATNKANGAVDFDTINYTLESVLADQRAGKNTFTSYTDEATGTTTNYWIYYYAATETIPENATATIDGTTYTYAEAQGNDSITTEQIANATWQKGDYLYDTSTFYYAVRITDRGNGKLNVVAGYVDKDGNTSTTSPIFVNELGPGNLSVTKTVADSSGDANKEFKFHVRLMGDEDKINALSPITWKVSEASTESSESGESNTGSENDNQADGTQQSGTNSTVQPASAPRRAPSTVEEPIATYYCNSFGAAVTVSTDEYYNGTKRNMAIDLYADGRMVVRPCKESTYAVGSSANFKHILDEIAKDFAEYDTYFSKIDLEFAEGIVPAGSDAMKGMFEGCSSIRSIDLSHFTGTSKLTDLTNAFSDCTSLETLDLSGVTMVDARNNIITSKAFSNCLALSSITLGSSFSFQTYADINPSNRLPDYNWKLDNGDGTYSPAISSSDLAALSGTDLQGTWVRVSPEYNIRFYEDSSDSAFYGNRYTEVSVPIVDPYTINTPLELLGKEEYATKEFVGWMMAYTGSPLGQEELINYIFGKPERNTTLTRSIDPIPPYNADDKNFLVVPGTVLGPIDPEWWTLGTKKGNIPLKLAAVWQDRSATITDGEFEFTLRAGQTATFEGLPAGTSYQVWEETEDGWELVSVSGDHGTIEPETTKNASFKNLYTPGKVSAQFSGTKTFDGQAPAAGRYSFQVVPVSTTASGLNKATMPMPGETAEEGSAERLALTGTGDDRIYTVANGESGFVQFPSISFEVDGEYVYEITEVVPNENDAAYEAATSYDGSTWTVTVNVTDGGDGTKSSTVTYNRNGSAAGKSSFKFENTSIPARLLLGKAVTEGSLTPANEDAEFTFKLRFLNEDGVPVANGTSFDWYYADANGNPINPDSDDPTDPEPEQRPSAPEGLEWHTVNSGGSNYEYALDPSDNTLWFRAPKGSNTGTWNTRAVLGAIDSTLRSQATKIRVEAGSTITMLNTRDKDPGNGSSSTALSGCTNLEEFYGSGFVVDESCKSLGSFFKGLSKLKTVDVSDWDVSGVTNFERMFQGTAIESIDLSSWNTSSATDMNRMFMSCSKLVSANFAGWDVSGVTTYSSFFNSCTNLEEVDFTGWATGSNITDSNLFTTSTTKVSKITIGNGMKLSNAKLNAGEGGTSGWRRLEDGATSSDGSFIAAGNNAGTWVWTTRYASEGGNTGAALIKAPVFKKLGEALVGAGADALAAVGSFVENALDTLMGVQSAYAEEISGEVAPGNANTAKWKFDTSTGELVVYGEGTTPGLLYMKNIRDFDGISSYLGSVKSVRFDNCEANRTSQAFYNMINFFADLDNVEHIDLSGLDTFEVEKMGSMFAYKTKLKTVNFGTPGQTSFTTENVSDMSSMFFNCAQLKALDLSCFDTSKVTTMEGMFSGCTLLGSLDLSNFQTPKLNDMGGMLRNCFSLVYLNLEQFDTSSLQKSPDSKLFSDNANEYCARPAIVVLGENWFKQKYEGLQLNDYIWTSGTTCAGSWVKQEDASATAYSPSQMLNLSPDELAGTWVFTPSDSSKAYLAYVTNGSSMGSASKTNRPMIGSGTKGSSLTLAAPTSRPGYAFVGWYEDPDFTGTRYKAGDSYTLANNANILYAKWISESEAVKVTTQHYKQNSDGTYNNTPDETVIAYFTYADLADGITPAVRSSYAAEGYVLPTAQTFTDAPGTVVYKYERKPYTVAYDANGGSGSMDSVSVKVGKSYSVAANEFTNAGSVFTGWNTKADGSGQAYIPGDRIGASAFDSVGAGGTLTLYAQWIENKNGPLTTAGGEVTVKLKPGQRIVFPKLPAGTTYEIVETDLPNGWSIDKATGEIVSGTTVTGTANAADEDEATFTNTYEAAGSVAVQAHKLLEGATAQDGQFTFQLDNPTGTQSYVLAAANQAQDSESGTAPILFPDINFTLSGIAADVAAGKAVPLAQLSAEDAASADLDPATVMANVKTERTEQVDDGNGNTTEQTVPDTATYVTWTDGMKGYAQPTAWLYTTKLAEVAGSNGAITYDTSEHEVQILVTDAGNGRLEATVLAGDSTEDPTEKGNTDSNVTFTNTMKDGNLQLTKTLVNATPAAQEAGNFTFTITLTDASGNPISGEYEAEFVVPSEDGSAEITSPYGGLGKILFGTDGAPVQLAGGQMVRIYGLPHGASYSIAESEAAGFVLTEGSSGMQGTIVAPSTVSATAENTYNTEGEANIVVTKTLNSANALEKDQFNFMLLDEDMRVISTATNGEPTEESLRDSDEFSTSALVDFGMVHFDLNDLYDGTGELKNQITRTYYVYEQNDFQENISYDDALYRVEITFTDNGAGHMDTAVVYFDAQGNPTGNDGQDNPDFLNRFVLDMPATGMPGVTGAGLLLAILIGSTTLMLYRRRKQMDAAQAATANEAFDPKSETIKAKGVQC